MRTSLYLFLLFPVLGLLSWSGNGNTNLTPEYMATDSTKLQSLWVKADSLEHLNHLEDQKDVLEKIHSIAMEQDKIDHLVLAEYKLALIKVRKTHGVDWENIIPDYQEKVKESTGVLQAFNQLILANLYLDYGKRYQYRVATDEIARETQGTFKDWSLAELQNEAFRLYREALSEPQLKDIEVTNIPKVISTLENVQFRPTLYDVVAQVFIESYKNQFNAITSVSSHPLYSSKQLFAGRETFLKMEIPADTTDTDTYVLHFIQEYLKYLIDKGAEAALAKTEIDRLIYAKNTSQLADKNLLYFKALRRLSGKNYTGEAREYILYQFLEDYAMEYDLNDYSGNEEAIDSLFMAHRNTYDEIIEKHGGKPIAQFAEAKKMQEARASLNLESEAQYGREKAILLKLAYKNNDEINYTVFSMENTTENHWDFRRMEIDEFLPRAEKKYRKERTLPLIPSYRNHTAELAIDGLDYGLYVILVKGNSIYTGESFKTAVLIQVSDLSAMNIDGNKIQVLYRSNGKVVPDAHVSFAYTRYNESDIISDRGNTDNTGCVSIPSGRHYGIYAIITNEEDKYITEEFSNYDYRYEPRVSEQINVFTDRSIYRPGQIVHFKAIVTYGKPGEMQPLDDRNISLTLMNVNNEKVSTISLTTDEYGAVTGTFPIPPSGLPGRYYIRAEGISGGQFIQVEEYKRPKFQVELEKPQVKLSLGQSTTIHGEAMAYAGYPVADADVHLTVTRQEYFIPYCFYFFFPRNNGSERILDVDIKTDEEGNFSQEIEFKASESEIAQERAFLFTIRASVTDRAGETHSSEMRLYVGTAPLLVKLSNFQEEYMSDEEISFKVQAQNSALQGVATQGEMTLTELVVPDEIILGRYWNQVDTILMEEKEFERKFPYLAYAQMSGPTSWKEKRVIKESDISLPANGRTLDFNKLDPGVYKLEFDLQDAVKSTFILTVLDAQEPFLYDDNIEIITEKKVFTPGSTVQVTIARPQSWQVYATIQDKDADILLRKSLGAGESGFQFAIPEKEDDVRILVYTIQHGRVKQVSRHIQVRKPEHQYSIRVLKIDRIVQPGDTLSWTFQLIDGNDNPVRSAGFATLYDKSLDALLEHNWNAQLQHDYFIDLRISDLNRTLAFNKVMYNRYNNVTKNWDFPTLSPILGDPLYGRRFRYYAVDALSPTLAGSKSRKVDMRMDAELAEPEVKVQNKEVKEEIEIRENLSELVFFNGDIRTDKQGKFTLDFVINEALTEWKLMIMTHDKQLLTASITETVKTQKDLMVQGHFPRFFREKDEMEIRATVIRTDGGVGSGTAELQFKNAITREDVSGLFDYEMSQEFNINDAGQAVVAWDITIPLVNKVPLVEYMLQVRMDEKADAVKDVLPIVTTRKFVTETIALFTPSESTQTFTFEHYEEKMTSNSLKTVAFQLDYVPNPVWEAIKAMPAALSDENVISALMQNYMIRGLAMKIIEENPEIKAVYQQWQREGDLQSNLSENQQVKIDQLSETPWVQAALSQTDRMRRIAQLFNLQQLALEQVASLRRLKRAQKTDGGWPWIEGGRYSSWFVTQMVLDYFVDLKKMRGTEFTNLENSMITPALDYIDGEFMEYWNKFLKSQLEKDRLISSTVIHYVRIRTQYEQEIPSENQGVIEKIVEKLQRTWMEYPLPSEVYVGLALRNYDENIDLSALYESVDQQLVKHEEMGAYFKGAFFYGFYAQSVPLTVAMMELFDPIQKYEALINQLKLFLLSHKRTNDWGQNAYSMKAIYGLLYYGNPIELNTENKVAIEWGGEPVEVKDREAGTGAFSLRKSGDNIENEDFESVTVVNNGETASWGGLYWQYFEDMDKVQAEGISTEFPISIDKNFYREVKTNDGIVLKAINDGVAIHVGDEITVQIILRVDRSMDFIHVQDDRPAGTEPLDVISGHKYDNGLWYYQATRDLSSDFYIASISPGQYTIEYKLVASHEGTFSAGLAVAQSYYAPEMSSHSEGRTLVVE